MGLLDDAIREHLELKRRRGADAGEITRQESEALGPARRSADPAPDAPAEPESRAEDLPAEKPGDRFTGDPGEPRFVDEPPAAPARVARAESPPRVREPEPEPPLRAREPEPRVREPEPPPRVREPEPPPRAREPEPEPPRPARAERREATDDPWDDETAAIVDEPPMPPGRPQRSAAERLAELDEYEARAAPPPPGVSPAGRPTTEFGAHDIEDATAAPPARPLDPLDDEPDIVPADEEPGSEDLLEETPEFLEETPEHDRLWFEQRPPRDFDFDG